MIHLFRDLRTGLRFLLRQPGLTSLAVLILGLGVGANTAIFSVIHSFLLRPLPYFEADRLVQVWNRYPGLELSKASVSVPDYLDRRSGVSAFAESALYFYSSFNLSSESRPERVIGVRATASLFALLRHKALLGRTFTEAEDEPGRDAVVVLSHALWQRAFGGDETVVGREIRLNAEPHRVVGVMPEGFDFPHPSVGLWRPFAFTPEQRSDEARGQEFAQMLARLAPGATLDQAQDEIDAIHAANRERFPESRTFWDTSGFGGLAIPYREELYGELRPTLFLLQGAVVFVLLIACANVANLLLTRMSSRRRELAVRSMLGAPNGRLVRQLLVESSLLGLGAGAVGLWMAYFTLGPLGRFTAETTGGRVVVSLNPGVLVFTAVIALITPVLFGLFPALSLLGGELNELLKEGGDRGSSEGRRATLTRNALVVAEIALALVLLLVAGLLIQSLAALRTQSLGFVGEGVLTAQVSLPEGKYKSPGEIVGFFDEALARLRGLAGVASVGIISESPFSNSSTAGTYEIEGYTLSLGETEPHALMRVVDPEFFSTLEIPFLYRDPSASFNSSQGKSRVAIVDRHLVDKYWPGENPLGKRLRRRESEGWITVVGVVAPIKASSLEEPVAKETIYLPYRSNPRSTMTFMIRTVGRPEAVTGAVRNAVAAIDPELPVYGVASLEERVASTLRTKRASTLLLSLFGGLAVVLAMAGVYGVLAFSVAQRLRELGMRMALGARPGDILRQILTQGAVLTAAGLALGLVLTLGASPLLQAFLFEITPYEPRTLIAVSLLVMGVSFAACYGPARRATRVSPIIALRDE